MACYNFICVMLLIKYGRGWINLGADALIQGSSDNYLSNSKGYYNFLSPDCYSVNNRASILRFYDGNNPGWSYVDRADGGVQF